MITEDYVSFETAKLLTEKGFEGRMHTFYTEEGVEMESAYVVPSNFFPIYRPTLQMAMKWLREVHKIDMWVECHNRRYKGYIHSEQRGDESLFYEDSYEDACETAIKYCLENLI